MLEINSATKLISETRKTNSEQIETRMYILERKYRMIVVPKAEEFLEWVRLDLYVLSQRLMAKGNVLYFHML